MIHAFFFTIIVSGNAIIGWREYHIFSLTILSRKHICLSSWWMILTIRLLFRWYSAHSVASSFPTRKKPTMLEEFESLPHIPHRWGTCPQSTWHLDGWNMKMRLPRLYWQQGGTTAYGPHHQGTYIQSPKPLWILLLAHHNGTHQLSLQQIFIVHNDASEHLEKNPIKRHQLACN